MSTPTKITNHPDLANQRLTDIFRSKPRIVGEVIFSNLTADITAGATSLPVTSSTGFVAGDEIRVGESVNAETVTIQGIPDSTTLTTSAILSSHSSGDLVINAPGAGLLTAFSLEIQELENTFFDCLEDRDIYSAEGVNLDRLGNNLGLPRPGGSYGTGIGDTAYRADLLSWVDWLLSQGEGDRLLRILRALTDSTDPDGVEISEHFPGNICMWFDGTIFDVDGSYLLGRMDDAAAAGIGVTLIPDPAGTFRWDGTDGVDGWDDGLWTSTLPLP